MKKLETERIQQLIEEAFAARKKAYAPYSGFWVGAALLTEDGQVYNGCNIENASYSATNCAERTAVFKAVSQGCHKFSAIAIVGGKGNETEICPPCGVCRQVLSEFCHPEEFAVILAKNEKEYKIYTLDELLPLAFSMEEDRQGM